MIEGVKIQISTDELKQRLLEKVDYHNKKCEFYSQKVKDLKGAESQDDPSLFNASNNPVDSLGASAKKHNTKASFFQFIVDHLVPNETYELSENDLSRLELISQYY